MNLELCDFENNNNNLTNYILIRWERTPKIYDLKKNKDLKLIFGCLKWDLINENLFFPWKDEIIQINCISKNIREFQLKYIKIFIK